VSNQHFISDEDLHAYIDGALKEGRVLAVRDALARNAALAERAALFQADKAMLKAVYAPLAKRPLPPEWIARVHRQARPRVPWRLAAGAIAAAILVLAGGSLAWRQYAPARDGDLVSAALDARDGTRAPEQHIALSDIVQAHRYDAALRQTVASNVHIPDLSRMGYRLRGLRLYGTAAELLYQGPQGRPFTLYMRRSDGSAHFDQFGRGSLRVCVWQDDQISTVMVGDISVAAMQRLAILTYTGLTSS
jgi:anti-sigma factor RsiW